METDAAGAAAQRADVLFLTNYGKTLEDVDAKKIAVIGYSWGGNAALAAAQATPDIRALVALDDQQVLVEQHVRIRRLLEQSTGTAPHVTLAH